MTEETWTQVDAYLDATIVRPDDALEAALQATAEAGMPMIAVSASQGKWLHLLARALGARRILEVGTLGGYSTIWLGQALPGDGRLVTLELSPKHAEVARANLARAGSDRPHRGQRSARRRTRLPPWLRAARNGFDLCFIDADKGGYPTYFRRAMELVRPGGVIVADNVVRDGGIADPASTDASVLGVRELIELAAADPRCDATVVQTVGNKGYDGFAFILVREPERRAG